MGNLLTLYTTTTGRIGRQQWWIGVIILTIATVLFTFFILPLIGLGMPNLAAIIAASSDPAASNELYLNAMRNAGWGSVVAIIIFGFPYYAVGVKRRHDRNNNGLDVLIYLILGFVVSLLQPLGLAYSISTVGDGVVASQSVLSMIAGGVMAIYALYLLVVCGCYRGTSGPNTYGPDPL